MIVMMIMVMLMIRMVTMRTITMMREMVEAIPEGQIIKETLLLQVRIRKNGLLIISLLS
jgi:hypothetical protein